MNIKELINKDIPYFTGISVHEGYVPLEKLREIGVSLAWKFNKNRAKKFDKILVAGSRQSKGTYFIADVQEIISTEELTKRNNYNEVIKYHESIFGNWITDRLDGKIIDNTLKKRNVIIFENPKKIENFSTKKFKFFSNPFIYVYGKIKEQTFDETLGERINLKNIGKIKKAEIKINGLTVIAGENDTGKSTVGKLIFSIVKAISRYEQDLNESKIKNINKKIEKLYFSLRQKGVFRIGADVEKYYDFRMQFSPREFQSQLHSIINITKTKIINIFPISEQEISKEVDRIFEYKYKLIDGLELPEREIKKYTKLLDAIKKNIFAEENKQEQIKRALKNALFSEFYSEITPKGTKKKSSVNYLSGNSNILNFEIENNRITTLNLEDELIFDDVIFIETPLLLQMYDLIRSSETLFYDDNAKYKRVFSGSVPKVSLHIKDLITKIEDAKYFSDNFFENEQIDILKKISSIIKGGYIFEQDEKDFVFSQKNGNKKNVKIRPTNTASGIKSFGIIQLLIQANILNDRSLLVVDEPENHLHPEWQLKYAEMIIELVKNDISVIISSHSPYMIQALKHYSEKENLKEKASYYLTEIMKDELYSNIVETTDNLNLIFSKLAKPLKELVWQ